jgi:hypothetical protein
MWAIESCVSSGFETIRGERQAGQREAALSVTVRQSRQRLGMAAG